MAEALGVPFEVTQVILVNGAMALVLGLFALVVGAMARFHGPAKWYSLFGLTFGIATFLNNVWQGFLRPFSPEGWTLIWDDIPQRTYAIATLLGWLQAVFMVGVGLSVAGLMASYGVGRPLRRPVLWILPGATVVAGILVVASDPTVTEAVPTSFTVAFYAQAVGSFIGIPWMSNAAIFMAFAYVRDRLPGQAILAAAMSAYPILYGGAGLATAMLLDVPFALYDLVMMTVTAPLMAIAWWWAYERTRQRAARRVAWLPPIWIAIAIGLSVWTDQSDVAAGLARAFDVLLVGYAILRLQYLGLDVKVRWGISKTTIAAVFVTVFFLASEGAQAFFGDRFQNEYFGIAVAGTLVFATTPLMRWADRVAERAVPVTMPATEVFAAAVHAALADGVISTNEEMHLARVAEGLGLTPTQVAAVRAEVGR